MAIRDNKSTTQVYNNGRIALTTGQVIQTAAIDTGIIMTMGLHFS